jgi:2-furoyl-CoA dehydrogenase large subunit
VADAIGREDISLPLTPSRVWHLISGHEAGDGLASHPSEDKSVLEKPDKMLEGEGETSLAGSQQAVWDRLLNPDALRHAIPGCESLTEDGPHSYRARVRISIAGIGGHYDARVQLSDIEPPHGFRMAGEATGALGFGRGEALVTLREDGPDRTSLSYRYSAEVGGRVASLGHRMLSGVTRLLIGQFFERFARQFGDDSASPGFAARLRNGLSSIFRLGTGR